MRLTCIKVDADRITLGSPCIEVRSACISIRSGCIGIRSAWMRVRLHQRIHSRWRQAPMIAKNSLKNFVNFSMFKVRDYINIDKEILGGNPVFKGTRVPVESLFQHLERGIPLDQFLLDFPSVTKDQAIAIIEMASKLLTSKDIEKIYETAA